VKRAHHDLKVWQESMFLVKMIYEISKKFPAEETYGLKVKFAEPQFPYPVILLRVLHAMVIKNFFNISILAVVL